MCMPLFWVQAQIKLKVAELRQSQAIRMAADTVRNTAGLLEAFAYW